MQGLKHFRRSMFEPYRGLIAMLGQVQRDYHLFGHEVELLKEKILMDDIQDEKSLREEAQAFGHWGVIER